MQGTHETSQEIGDVGHPAMGVGIEPKAHLDYPTLQLVAGIEPQARLGCRYACDSDGTKMRRRCT